MNALFCSITLAALSLAGSAAGAAAIAVQVTDNSGKPLADVVVSAAPDGNAAVPQTLKAAEIEQRGLKFLPLVSVIQTGSKISFPNFDKVKHHIYSFSPAKKFDQKLYSGVAAAPQVFDKAGTVVLGCNIHDGMVAYIRVVDTPFFARTDAAGVARIELPAAGKYTLSSWHFNMAGAAAEQSLAVKAEGATAASVRLALKAPAADAAAP
ncbi:methylamine utilization protein [Massilia violaceinigra]|uniref:Methylamine utilization protein n=1 Tax=Massilia violaceinigra TaxID=2045208 RepID=A0ABY4A2P1_9BURK|nr:methylamine utilization protein [Massilia violaceinigra]UOD29029.1 methylamine utilization protein [Massilia violaceinigra]